MKSPRRSRASAHLLWIGALVVLLTACSSPSRREVRIEAPDALVAQLQRERVLRDAGEWSLRGRIAVSDGRDGGSGRIDWRQDGDDFVIEIRAPVSRRTWRLSQSGEGAVLEGLDEGIRRGTDAERLLHEAVGWSLPLADMVAWARGARGTSEARVAFDEAQRPARIEQHGWTIEYRAWDESSRPLALPTKVFASRGAQRVRLIVEQWDGGR